MSLCFPEKLNWYLIEQVCQRLWHFALVLGHRVV